MHINWLELTAILFGVKCFFNHIIALLKFFCDNSTAIAYVSNLRGMVPTLHANLFGSGALHITVSVSKP